MGLSVSVCQQVTLYDVYYVGTTLAWVGEIEDGLANEGLCAVPGFRLDLVVATWDTHSRGERSA